MSFEVGELCTYRWGSREGEGVIWIVSKVITRGPDKTPSKVMIRPKWTATGSSTYNSRTVWVPRGQGRRIKLLTFIDVGILRCQLDDMVRSMLDKEGGHQ